MLTSPNDNYPSQQEYLSEVLLSLETSYKSTDKDLRKKAEKNLKKNSTTILQKLPIIIETLKSKSISKELSNSLLIYIRSTIVQMKEKSQISRDYVIELIKTVVNAIVDQCFPDYCLKEMNQIFEEIINNSILEKDESIIHELITLFNEKIMRNSISPQSYSKIGYIFENILCASCVNNNNSKEIIKIELICSDFMLKNIIHILDSFSMNNQSDLEQISLYINTIKVIYELLLNISVHSQKTYKNAEEFQNILTSYFLNIAMKFLEIKYEDRDLNCIKMKTKILKYIISFIPLLPIIINDKETLEAHSNLIMFCINNLNIRGELIKLIKNNTNKYPKNFAEQMLDYLRKIAFTPSFKSEFDKVLVDFTKNSLFPLLISDNMEIKEIESDEAEVNYANFIYDLTTKRKGKGLKTSIAKFINNACKINEKYIKFILEYCISLIQISLKAPLINQLYISKDNYMISNEVDDNQRIETSFLVLCLICKIIKKNSLTKTLLEFFQTHFLLISEKIKQCPIIKERVCLFISIYIECFLNETIDINIFNEICEILFYNIFKEEKQIARYESFEAVKSFIGNSKIKNSLTVILGKFSNEFLSYTEKETNPLYFNILSEIITQITSEEILLRILKTLFLRVIKEISPRRLSHSDMRNERNLSSNYKIIINKCFGVIRTIFNNTIFIQNNFSHIEQFIDPLLHYMKYPNKIDFDDDIIIIMTIIIKTMKHLPPCALKLLPDLNQYLRKNKGLMLDLFELLDEYIINSNSVIENKEDYCKIIFKNYKKSFAKEANYDKSPFLGACLIQIWFLNSKNIPSKVVIDIILFSLEQLKNLLLSEKCNHSDISIKVSQQNLSISLIVLLFVAFVNYPIIAYNNINFEVLIGYLEYQKGYQIYSSYQIKLLIIGICAIIQNEIIVKNCSKIISYLLSYSFHFLCKLKKFETKSLKEKDSKAFKEELIDSDNEMGEEVELELECLEMEQRDIDDLNSLSLEDSIYDYKEIDERIINPFKKVDEYQLFKESIEILKEKCKMVYNRWYDELEDEEVKKLANILCTTRIIIEGENKGTIDIPRKIIKIKKNNDNNKINSNTVDNHYIFNN